MDAGGQSPLAASRGDRDAGGATNAEILPPGHRWQLLDQQQYAWMILRLLTE